MGDFVARPRSYVLCYRYTKTIFQNLSDRYSSVLEMADRLPLLLGFRDLLAVVPPLRLGEGLHLELEGRRERLGLPGRDTRFEKDLATAPSVSPRPPQRSGLRRQTDERSFPRVDAPLSQGT